MAYKRKGRKKKRSAIKATVTTVDTNDYLSNLSFELICKILDALPIREVVCLSLLSKKLYEAVQLHLGFRRSVHFTDERLYGYLPSSLTDEQFIKLLAKCPRVEVIYGLNPRRIERRRLRRTTRSSLSIPRVIFALSTCKHLKGVETSHLKLMEAILSYLPQVAIVGHFRNHNGRFPVPAGNRLELPGHCLLTSLHLTGIEVPELPSIPSIRYIFLQWVRFTKSQPFRDFSAPELETFTMRHCIGPGNPLRFVPLVFELAFSTKLKRLEMVGITFLGRLLQRVTEENIHRGGFKKLEKVVFGACRNIVEFDFGYLMLASAANISDISIQPSLSRDSMFLSLKMAEASFPNMKTLQIGFVDDFPRKGLWSRADLLAFGLDDVVELPAAITDAGLKNAGMLFPSLTKLTIYNCPHLVNATLWHRSPEDRTTWNNLTELCIAHCHCLRLEDFLLYLAYLPAIKCLVLEDVFREPPKGCTYVGLSAGTGLGMSSAIVSNQQELIAVNGNDMEAVRPVALADNRDQLSDDDDDDDDENDYEDGDNSNGAARQGKSEARKNRGRSPDGDSTANNGVQNQTAEYPKCGECGFEVQQKVDFANPQPSTSRTTCTCSPPDSEMNTKFQKNQEDLERNNILRQTGKLDVECTAHSDDIRQEIRRASLTDESGDQSEVEGNRQYAILEGRASRYKSVERRGNHKAQKTSSNICSKSVGTSDPILEDDYQQTLRIMSDTLQSLVVIACGVSDICLRHCPKLEHLEVEACRILHNIRVRRCNLLVKVAISQCPKMDAVAIVKNMGRLPARRNRFLFIQPFLGSGESSADSSTLPAQFPQFDPIPIERTALQWTSLSYNVAVVVDTNATFDFRLPHRQATFRWLQLITKINNKLIMDHNFTRSPRIRKQQHYPWDRNLYHMQGQFLAGNYAILSDLPWIRDLWASIHSNKEWHGFMGLYRPDRHGHTLEECIRILEPAIYERKSTDPYLQPYSFSVYIHDPDQRTAQNNDYYR